MSAPPSFTIVRLPVFCRALVFRGAVFWVGVRLAAAFAGIVDPNPAQEVLIVGVVAWIAVWDARRRGEDLFLANLGVPASGIALAAAFGAACLEVLVP